MLRCWIETRPPDSPEGDYELRVSSLNRGSENILRQINAWQYIDEARAHQYQKVQVGQENSSSRLTFDCADAGEPYMGHMIENANTVQALLKQANANKNNSVIHGITIRDLIIDDDAATLTTDQGDIRTRLVIGADGPRSLIRKLSGFNEVQGFYGQQCIVGTIHFDGDHHQNSLAEISFNRSTGYTAVGTWLLFTGLEL